MPTTLDPSLRGLNDCTGCTGLSPETPVRVDNRAGLDTITYRNGTHARFLESMLARLSSSQYAALRTLKTRATDDLTIALLDACAAVDDGLTFYTERYANEWFVRTAAERISLVELARLIGYEPRPGVAAGTYLAFTIEDTPGTPEQTTIAAGTKVMSIPGKDELPQTFETMATIAARSTWNAMKARTHAPQAISTAMEQVVLDRLESAIHKGDRVLIIDDTETPAIKIVRRVVQNTKAVTTTLELSNTPTPSVYGGLTFTVRPLAYTMQPFTNTLFDNVFTGLVYNSSDVALMASVLNWSTFDFLGTANTPPKPLPSKSGVYALRQRAAIFGHNAPRWATLPQLVDGEDQQLTGNMLKARKGGADEIPETKWQYPNDWDNYTLDHLAEGVTNAIDLDNTYPQMIEKGWIVLESPSATPHAYRIEKNQELTRSDFTLSVKVTRLTLDNATHLRDYAMRKTTVYGQSEQLPLAQVELTGDVQDNTITLDGYYPGLVQGQYVIITGERTDLKGAIGIEVRQLAAVQIDGTLEAGRLFTRLIFTTALDHSYHRETVRVNANVVYATHGESKGESLGSGNGVSRFQTFALKQQPLTYVSAQTPTGARSTLEVRINRVLWTEVPSLYAAAPDAKVYVVRHQDNGTTRVQLNAPIPSGQENVSARYRIGIGQAGMVKADQLTLLTQRPLGVRSVTNPLAPSGAEDPESIADLRENSPLTVLTLDRLVSLQDYEDFARAFAGFSKALAVPTSDGAQRGIFLTVAGETGVVETNSQEFSNLVAALQDNGDPFVQVVVKPYRPAYFQVEGTIGVDPAYLEEDVIAAVEAALRVTFSFERRRFGQTVTEVEVVAVMQNVPGVVYVALTYLFRSDPLNPSVAKSRNDLLPAMLPIANGSRLHAIAAELLILDPRPLQLSAVSLKG